MKKRITILGVSLLNLGSWCVLYAQQDPMYTQYMYNATVINPAYAASKETMSFFGLYRNQWIGIEGAPKTANIGFTTPLQNSNLGLGVNFVNDHIGALDENSISFDLAYTLELNGQYKLALGVKGTANLLSLSYSKLNIYDQTSVYMYEDIKNRFNPNVGAGTYFFSDVAYLGLSVPKVFNTDYYDDIKRTIVRQKPVFYLIGGYVFDLGQEWLVKPAFLSKIGKGKPSLDLTANFLFQEKFTIGTAYRWNASISALTGVQINSEWFIGYTYDFDTSKINPYNAGSHEIFMRFDWVGSFQTTSRKKARFF
ncbi:type IX secretion system membrane protein PorP/SprF [Myroides odoratus]|uniref:PorP/SprF family type IX secretion system membrane protein n=1 Tax=Myroides odoratus TaxID=256 RepID=UPI0039AEA546